MSDAALRALEQRFRASGSFEDEVVWLRTRLQVGELSEEELRLEAYRGRPAARAALEGRAGLDRWDRLTAGIARWYVTPLRGEDGVSAEELAQAEARLGLRLPVTLREWFRLVGRRVCFANQDHPVLLDELAVRAGLLVLLHENQGNWIGGVPVEALDQENPPFEVDLSDLGQGIYRTPLAEFLQLYVLCETVLAGSVQSDPSGPLGAMAAGVRGTSVAGFGGAYPRLFEPDYLWGGLYGDAETLIVEGTELGLARTPEAWERLSAFATPA